MKITDRYIVRQFIGPFLVGVVAFAGILLGIGEIYQAVQLVVRDGVPLLTVIEVFLLHIPTVVALTMPMAAVFAALMAAGELSSHGEVVAMRAGGISVSRMALSVIIAGAAISVMTFVFNEAVSPWCNDRATTLVADYLQKSQGLQRHVMLRIPEEGEAQRLVYADKLDLQQQVLLDVTIIEFDKGKPRDVYFAERAEWRGTNWYLINVVHKEDTGRGYREEFAKTIRHDIGRSPSELNLKGERRPEDMTLRQLQAEVQHLSVVAGLRPSESERKPPSAATGEAGLARVAVPRTADHERMLWLLQHFHLRIATPWAAMCFTILGFPLGMRPQRTSTSVGFGISLAIVFVYYIVMNVLRAFGEQAALSPVLAAWAPNVVVLGVGLGLLLEASR